MLYYILPLFIVYLGIGVYISLAAWNDDYGMKFEVCKKKNFVIKDSSMFFFWVVTIMLWPVFVIKKMFNK